MAGPGNAGSRQPKFLFLMIFDVAILTCFVTVVSRSKRILSLKPGENQHHLRSVDVASYRVLRSKNCLWDVPSATANQRFAVISSPSATANQRFAVISSKYFEFYSFIKAEVRVAGFTRDDWSAPVRGADPLRQKRAR